MSTPPLNPASQRIRRAAAEWLTKHDRGLTAAEQDEFFQWLAADALHGAWFSRHRASWQRLDAIAAGQPAHGAEPNPAILARPVQAAWWKRTTLIAAMAAGLALAAGVIWMRTPARFAATASAEGGYERRVFEDGSVVELNRGAEIEVNFTPTERQVVLLRGEALFTVTKDPSRPFLVHTRGVDVRAVGTAFNVRLDSASIEVLVTEGKVQVAQSMVAAANAPSASGPVASPPLVTAGERVIVPLTVDAAPQIARTTEAELARVRAWQPQLLDFSSTPLEEVLSEFNRRNRVKLALADPKSARLPIVASIRSDNIEGFVSLVATAAGLQAERRSDYEIVLRAAK